MSLWLLAHFFNVYEKIIQDYPVFYLVNSNIAKTAGARGNSRTTIIYSVTSRLFYFYFFPLSGGIDHLFTDIWLTKWKYSVAN